MDANASTTSINKEDEEFKTFLDLLSRVSANAEFKENYENSYFTKTKLTRSQRPRWE